MAINNGYRYVENRVRGDLILEHIGRNLRLVSQRPYKGKPEDGLKPGATCVFQINEDNSPPIIDKETGLPKDNNVLETFTATIVGCDYPLPFKKGDYVELGGFMPEASYYIDYNFILRFSKIKAVNKQQPQTPPQAQPTEPTQPTQPKSLTPKST